MALLTCAQRNLPIGISNFDTVGTNLWTNPNFSRPDYRRSTVFVIHYRLGTRSFDTLSHFSDLSYIFFHSLNIRLPEFL